MRGGTHGGRGRFHLRRVVYEESYTITHRDCCFPKLRIFRQMALHGERRAKEGFRGAEILTPGASNHILTRNTTHIAVKTRKSLAYFSIHKSFFIHAYYQKKLVNHFSPKENSPKPSLPLTFKNRTAQNAFKTASTKPRKTIINFRLTTIQHPLD